MKTAFVMIILICAFPSVAISGARDALFTCFNTVIPSLFPFFVISKMFIKSGGAYYLGKIFAPVMKTLFKINPNGALPFVLGLVSGYPVGASSVCECYKKGEITRDEAQNLIGFCNNSGPSFIIGAVGCALLGNKEIGYALYVVHILSSISVGICVGKNIKQVKVSERRQVKRCEKNVFTSAVEESVMSILSVCGYVIFFAVVIAFISRVTQNVLVLGFFELTSAIKILCEKSHASLSTKFVIISVICAFASLSVNMQTKRIISNTDLSFKKYICAKCLQAVFAFIYSVLYVTLFKESIPAFSLDVHGASAIETPYGMAILCAVIFIVYVFRKKVYKPLS